MEGERMPTQMWREEAGEGGAEVEEEGEEEGGEGAGRRT